MTESMTLEEINQIFGEDGEQIFQEMTQVLIANGIEGYSVVEVKLKPADPGVDSLCCRLFPFPPMCWIC